MAIHNINHKVLLGSLPVAISDHLRCSGFGNPTDTWYLLSQIDKRLKLLGFPGNPFPALVESAENSLHPDRALINLHTLVMRSIDDHIPGLMEILTIPSESRDALLTILSCSQYLSTVLLHDQNFLLETFQGNSWRNLHSATHLETELSKILQGASSPEEAMEPLRTFKKEAYLQIAVCDLMKEYETQDILERLTDVAEICLQAAHDVCCKKLEEQHGQPLLSGSDPSGFAIIGMGKLGGRELNFSSDIDLLYVYDATNGKTKNDGLSTYEYYPKLARAITHLIGQITPNGQVFRVDLRLRPAGRAGDIANSIEGYRWHYEVQGQPWQRQALLKARCSAGSMEVGEQFLGTIHPFIFDPARDHQRILEDINQMRERITRALMERGRYDYNVKLGTGGIREIEFIVQGLQLVHAGFQKSPWERSTRGMLASLADEGCLSDTEVSDLDEAYLFLRDLENRIQMRSGHQTHEIPQERNAQTVLGGMMKLTNGSPFPERRKKGPDKLLSAYGAHTTRVHQVYNRVFHSAI